MLKKSCDWENWEKEFQKQESLDYWQKLKIYEALYEHARYLNVLPGDDPLEGIEHKIELARKLNVPLSVKKDC